MKISTWWSLVGVGLLGASLAGCGGNGGSGSGELRLINATLTHASLDLVEVSNAAQLVSSVAIDKASAYASVPSGSTTAVQINDTGSSTALIQVTPTIIGSQHSAMVAYESSGVVKVALIGEETVAPAAGTSSLRIFDAATDGGSVDVYVTPLNTDITNLSPTFTLKLTTFQYTGGFLSFKPGTYEVRVYGQGSKTDLRLDIPSITIADQQIGTVVLVPASGGVLVNGGLLIQQGDYAASRNTQARIRVAAAAAANAEVKVTAGGTTVADLQSPTVGNYVTVPAKSVLAVDVAGTAVTAPVGGLLAGTDSTLLVYDDPTKGSVPTATLIADDNHLPTSTSNYKMRLVNGVTGTATTLTLRAGAALLAGNVTAGTASAYGLATGNVNSASTVLQVSSPLNAALYTAPGQSIIGNSVYSFFVFGTPGEPYPLFIQDNTVATQ